MDEVVLNNRYRLLELVGSGGMAVVYRGLDTLLEREVAVKVLREGYASDPAFLARFRREAQAAANLQHPNIVTVYDVGEDGARHYIVMEYVHGQDLKTLIRQAGQLPVEEALDIAVQISSGAGHAHRMGLVHCDVKPQNVLVTEDGWAKVTDFGISRALSELGLTESETVWGSPIYFSPEQAAGEPPSPASDVYSIGIVLYEMLAGAPPFQADKSAALALMHLREDPLPLVSLNPLVPPQLDWIVRKTLSKDPAARYDTGEELAYVLDGYHANSALETGMLPAAGSRTHAPEGARTASRYARTGGEVGPAEPVDRVTLVLSAIALVAVIGLIPLWILVYRAYSASAQAPASPTAEALPLDTPAPDHAVVPALVGRSVEEATATLRSLRIEYVVEEREMQDGRAGVVLEQDPLGGEEVAAASVVRLIVSALPRELTMPHVVQYSLDAVREGLELDGMLVHTDVVWSGQLEGLILSQEPEGGRPIRAGDTVSLTVSGGTAVPIDLRVRLGDLFVLESAALPAASFRSGEQLALGLRWLPLQETGVRYTVFVHLIGPDGTLVAQRDEEPRDPTSTWVDNRVVNDQHVVSIPGDASPGLVQVRVGMYLAGQPAARVPVVDPGLTSAEAGSILIAQIEILP